MIPAMIPAWMRLLPWLDKETATSYLIHPTCSCGSIAVHCHMQSGLKESHCHAWWKESVWQLCKDFFLAMLFIFYWIIWDQQSNIQLLNEICAFHKKMVNLPFLQEWISSQNNTTSGKKYNICTQNTVQKAYFYCRSSQLLTSLQK